MPNSMKERLTTPLVRENGKHRRASLGRGAGPGCRGIPRGDRKSTGRARSGMFSCSKTTNELNYVAQKFVRSVIGTKQHRQLQPDLTRARASPVLAAVFGAGGGTSSYREIEECEVILLWGSNARGHASDFFFIMC